MAEHGRTLIWLSRHQAIKAEPLSGIECALLCKDEASHPQRHWKRMDLIFTARLGAGCGDVSRHSSVAEWRGEYALYSYVKVYLQLLFVVRLFMELSEEH
ncbi:hypothetical protein VZT92_010518 [Zoarces viviparus]|uniref:Uncharacterized protein n=1 Tax=Zoarces viviparus TaxID=48416 RepID=A0AAW1F918_ZOAVI